MTAREKYDRMIWELVGPDLKSGGFRRARNRFARRREAAWQIIDFQASQWSSRDEVSFTINLGVAIDGLVRFSNWDEKKPPSEAAAHLRERLPALISGCDDWWQFSHATDDRALAHELLDAVRDVGLPWLDARCGLPRVLSMIEATPEELGWHDLSMLPGLLADAGHQDAARALHAEAARRGSP